MVVDHEIARNDGAKSPAEPSPLHFEFTQEISKQQTPGGGTKPDAVHPEAVSCSTTTSLYFPDNRYWYCGGTGGYNSAAQSGLIDLGTNAKSTSVLNNSPSTHQFFVFAKNGDYNGYCGGVGSPSVPCVTIESNERGHTWQDPATSKWYTVLIEEQQGSTNPTVIATRLQNTMAHEAGHHLDINYGNMLGWGAASVVGHDFDTKLNAAVYGDIVKFNALPTVHCTGVGLYTKQLSELNVEGPGTGNRYMCDSTQTATIGGTSSTGHINLTVTDPLLSGGMLTIIEPVTAGQSATTIATNLASDINTETHLHAAGITATAASGVVTLDSETGNATTYSATVTGTETVTIPGSPSFGTGPSLREFYSGNNWSIVQKAWPEIFSTEPFGNSSRWAELYAEETAVDFSSSEATNQTPDLYIKNDGFVCTKLIVTHLTNDGRLPTTAEYTSSHCN